MTRRRSIPRAACAGLLAISLLTLATGDLAAQPPPSAEALADRVLGALGGAKAWEATRFVHFTFAGRRSHWWDRYDGRHRVEGKTKDGQAWLVLENVQSRQGVAYLDGRRVEGDEAAKLLETAYGTFINDTYWLLMPYKLRDPGVHLALAGEETIDGVVHDKLEISFDHVGLTPGDRYWAFVDRATGRMVRWAYLLESAKPGEGPTAWDWLGWRDVGGIQLAPTRKMVGSDRTLELGEISTAAIPDRVFTDPAPVVATP